MELTNDRYIVNSILRVRFRTVNRQRVQEALVLWEAGDETWEVVSGPEANPDIVSLDAYESYVCRANLPGEAIPQTTHPRNDDVYLGCELCRQEGFQNGLQPEADGRTPRQQRRIRICGLAICRQHCGAVMRSAPRGYRTCPYCTQLIDHVWGPYTLVN